MKSYIIHFLRHGMTESNIKGIYTGTTDIPLCEKGENQLVELREKYDYGKPDLIFTSPLTRCKQTAHIIFGEKARLNVVDGLHELSMGDFEGKTAEEAPAEPEVTPANRFAVSFRVVGTIDQLKAMKKFLIDGGYEYEQLN